VPPSGARSSSGWRARRSAPRRRHQAARPGRAPADGHLRPVQEIEHEIGETGRFSLRVTSRTSSSRADEGDTARVRIEFDLRASERGRGRSAVRESASACAPATGCWRSPSRSAARGLAGHRAAARDRQRPDRRTDHGRRPGGRQCQLWRCQRRRHRHRPAGIAGVQDRVRRPGPQRPGRSIRVSGVSSDVSLRAEAPIELRARTPVSGDISAFAPRCARRAS
jgi:hypothetical protein